MFVTVVNYCCVRLVEDVCFCVFFGDLGSDGDDLRLQVFGGMSDSNRCRRPCKIAMFLCLDVGSVVSTPTVVLLSCGYKNTEWHVFVETTIPPVKNSRDIRSIYIHIPDTCILREGVDEFSSVVVSTSH